MTWKDLPTWLKWGLSFSGFYIALVVLMVLSAASSSGGSLDLGGVGYLLAALLPFSWILEQFGISIESAGMIPTILISNVLLFFIIGAIIGKIRTPKSMGTP
tara:strand:+ start:420 stop:725 length:306 start_codon:yes stop_codon:yes gene_type:complete